MQLRLPLTQVHPLEEDELEEEDPPEEEEVEEEQMNLLGSQSKEPEISIQQSAMPLLQTGSRPTIEQVGVEPAGQRLPDEQPPLLDEEEPPPEEELEEVEVKQIILEVKLPREL